MKKQMTKITLAVTFEIPTKWVPPDVREEVTRGPLTQEQFFNLREFDGEGGYESIWMQLRPSEIHRDQIMQNLVDSLDHEIIEAVRDHLCTNGYLGTKYIEIPKKKPPNKETAACIEDASA